MKQKIQNDKPKNPGVLNCSIFLSDKKRLECFLSCKNIIIIYYFMYETKSNNAYWKNWGQFPALQFPET